MFHLFRAQPQDQHDRWWANFVRASTLRMVEIRKAYGESRLPEAALLDNRPDQMFFLEALK